MIIVYLQLEMANLPSPEFCGRSSSSYTGIHRDVQVGSYRSAAYVPEAKFII